MFETKGTIGLDEIKELMAKDMPHLNRNALILAFLFILLACTYQFGTWPFTVILLLSLLPLHMRRVYQRRYIGANMTAILRVTGGQQILPVMTYFEQDKVIMTLPNAVPQVEIAYQDLSKLTITEHLVVLGTKAHQAVYIFRQQVDNAQDLLRFLKSRNTQIPTAQLSLLNQLNEENKHGV